MWEPSPASLTTVTEWPELISPSGIPETCSSCLRQPLVAVCFLIPLSLILHSFCLLINNMFIGLFVFICWGFHGYRPCIVTSTKPHSAYVRKKKNQSAKTDQCEAPTFQALQFLDIIWILLRVDTCSKFEVPKCLFLKSCWGYHKLVLFSNLLLECVGTQF